MFSCKLRFVVLAIVLMVFTVFDVAKASLIAPETTNKLSNNACFKLNPEYLQRINILLSQKKYQSAYQVAKTINVQGMGDLKFDLLYGKAALYAHKPDVANLAFERVLMQDPANIRGRIGLAESYYGLKMYNEAKVELQSVLSSNINSTILNREIQRLVSRIDKKAAEGDFSYRFYGRMSFGYDDNAAATTDEDFSRYLDLTGAPIKYNQSNADQVATYNELIDELRENNKKYKSTYIYPKIGIAGKYTPKSKGKSGSRYNLFWDVNIAHKDYEENGSYIYNVDQLNLSFAGNYRLDDNYLLNGGIYYQEYLLNKKRNRETPLFSLGITRKINKHNNIKFYTNDGFLIYPNDRSQSMNMYVGGLEWLYSDGYNLLITQVFYGKNIPKSGAAKYNGKDYFGIDIAAKRKLTEKLSLSIGGICQNSLYDGINTAIPAAPVRHDVYKRASAGIYYSFNKNYTWYATASYTDTYSNVFMYKYDRTEVVTGFNIEF